MEQFVLDPGNTAWICVDVGRGLCGVVDAARVGVLLRWHDAFEVRAEHDDDELRRVGRGWTRLDAVGLLRSEGWPVTRIGTGS